MKKKTKIILAFVRLIIIAFYSFSFIQYRVKYGKYGIGDNSRLFSYKSDIGKYSMLIPQSWTVKEISRPRDGNKYLINIITTSNPKTYVNVLRLESNLLSENDLLKWEENKNAELNPINQISLINTKYGLNEGMLNEFTYQRSSIFGDYIDHCYDWIVDKNGGYIFVYCIDDELWKYGKPIFIKMIESIEFR